MSGRNRRQRELSADNRLNRGRAFGQPPGVRVAWGLCIALQTRYVLFLIGL